MWLHLAVFLSLSYASSFWDARGFTPTVCYSELARIACAKDQGCRLHLFPKTSGELILPLNGENLFVSGDLYAQVRFRFQLQAREASAELLGLKPVPPEMVALTMKTELPNFTPQHAPCAKP